MTTDRRRGSGWTPTGYPAGPAAATEATARALERLRDPRAVVLVEGVSDQIAVEAAAVGHDRDPLAERVAVVPIGGAQAIGKFLRRFGTDDDLRLVGMCDAGEEAAWQRALHRQFGIAKSTDSAAAAGFHVCRDDLEDELIRAVGPADVTELFAANSDLRAFRTLQQQAAWAGRPIVAQMRRFIASGARRKLRYAGVLTNAAVVADRVPAPLAAVIAAAFAR